jgi:hypothetical protein
MKNRSRWVVPAVAVLAVGVGTIGLYRLVGPGRIALPPEPGTQTEYLAIFLDGKKVGHAVQTRTVEAGLVTTSDDMSITVRRLGFPLTVQLAETSVETAAGQPLRFETTQNLASVVMKTTGTIKGDVLELVTSQFGVESKQTKPWPADALMAEGLRLLMWKRRLRPGTAYTANVFSPGTMQAVSTKIAIGAEKEVDLLGRVVKLTEMTTIMSVPNAGEITSTSYVNAELETLKSIVPLAGMRVEMISCPKEFALGNNDVAEVIDRMFVKSPVSLDDLGSATSIAYTLKPVNDANFVIPTTDNQKAERLPDGRMLLVVRPVKPGPGGTFPYRGRDPRLLEATQPTRFLRSDDKRIVALARQAVGDTKDAADAARRIESFVARYITIKNLSVGQASAVEVAESRQGDCSEFAVLTAALCRAVGIPAQVVAGIAYVRDFAGMEGFGAHAWTQVHLGGDEPGQGGQWVSLDAAFQSSGRGGYDAGHIALAVGDGEPGDLLNIASALGQFTIEKIELRRAQ